MLDPYYPLRCWWVSNKYILVSVSAIKHGGLPRLQTNCWLNLIKPPNFLIAQRKHVWMQDTVPLVLTFSIVVGFYFPTSGGYYKYRGSSMFFPLTLTAPASNALLFHENRTWIRHRSPASAIFVLPSTVDVKSHGLKPWLMGPNSQGGSPPIHRLQGEQMLQLELQVRVATSGCSRWSTYDVGWFHCRVFFAPLTRLNCLEFSGF